MHCQPMSHKFRRWHALCNEVSTIVKDFSSVNKFEPTREIMLENVSQVSSINTRFYIDPIGSLFNDTD